MGSNEVTIDQFLSSSIISARIAEAILLICALKCTKLQKTPYGTWGKGKDTRGGTQGSRERPKGSTGLGGTPPGK